MTGFYVFFAILSALTIIVCTALVAGNKLAVEKEKTKQETLKAAMQKAKKEVCLCRGTIYTECKSMS